VGLLADHGAMDVLTSLVLLHPTDPERSRVFYLTSPVTVATHLRKRWSA
jgi:hypothetical protein